MHPFSPDPFLTFVRLFAFERTSETKAQGTFSSKTSGVSPQSEIHRPWGGGPILITTLFDYNYLLFTDGAEAMSVKLQCKSRQQHPSLLVMYSLPPWTHSKKKKKEVKRHCYLRMPLMSSKKGWCNFNSYAHFIVTLCDKMRSTHKRHFSTRRYNGFLEEKHSMIVELFN